MAPRGSMPIPPIPAHMSASVDPDPFADYVYFAEDAATGLVKIGTTFRNRLMARIREHERALGRPIVLLATTPGGRRVEREYHRALAGTEDRREWFRPSERLTGFIEGAAYWGEWAGLLAAEGERQSNGQAA